MLVASTTLSKRKTIATILKIEDLGNVFWGNLLFFFSGISPCCSGGCFNLLRGLFHFLCMAYRHVARHICFNLLRGLLFPVHGISPCCSAHLFLFCFAVFCNSCTPPADRFWFLQIGCFRHSQVSCCSRTPGAPRLPSCERLRSELFSMRRMKWRYATAE